MLTFRSSTFLFFLVTGTFVLAGLFTFVPVPVYFTPAILYLGVLFYGSYCIDSGFFMEVPCKGNGTSREVALTFDDGPSPATTPRILDVLKTNNIHAAFFCIGKKIEPGSDVVKRMVEEGHLVGNHSYSHHFFFDLFPKSRMRSELNATNNTVKQLTGKKMMLFRPPYGVTTPGLAKVVRKLHMQPVGWSLRSMDTITKNPGKLLEKIDGLVQPGDIILLHDTCDIIAGSCSNP